MAQRAAIETQAAKAAKEKEVHRLPVKKFSEKPEKTNDARLSEKSEKDIDTKVSGCFPR